jgi:hypothetical protein
MSGRKEGGDAGHVTLHKPSPPPSLKVPLTHPLPPHAHHTPFLALTTVLIGPRSCRLLPCIFFPCCVFLAASSLLRLWRGLAAARPPPPPLPPPSRPVTTPSLPSRPRRHAPPSQVLSLFSLPRPSLACSLPLFSSLVRRRGSASPTCATRSSASLRRYAAAAAAARIANTRRTARRRGPPCRSVDQCLQTRRYDLRDTLP